VPQQSPKALLADLERRELMLVTREAELNRRESTVRRLELELQAPEPQPEPAPVPAAPAPAAPAPAVLPAEEWAERDAELAALEKELAARSALHNRRVLVEREQLAVVRVELEAREADVRALWEELRFERRRLDERDRGANRAAADLRERASALAARQAAVREPVPQPPAAAPAPAVQAPSAQAPDAQAPTAARPLAEQGVAEATMPGSARPEAADAEWWAKVLGRPVAVGA
jgi:hypothetical protein